MTVEHGVQVLSDAGTAQAQVLTPEALEFIAALHREFDGRRRALLAERQERWERLRAGEQPDFLEETRSVRESDWQVPPAPADLQDRRVEITGPTDRKMVINALNSGARVFMADFEDANSPTWSNMVNGQANLIDAVRRSIDFTQDDGREYRLGDKPATLVVRPRGWHLDERHLEVDGEPVSGSLVDFGLYCFHNARELLDRGSGPYYYLAKLEGHREARLWHDVFAFSERWLEVPAGTVRATVLIETILAAFEMEEILYELGEHATALNAGRWDYIFSIIKKMGARPEFLLPNRTQISMTVPFMDAYSRLLAATCHRRGAHAIGGMAAFIPNRRDPDATARAFARVRADKEREAGQGFDGTWVAHPDLVGIAREIFDGALGARPNQLERQPDVAVTSHDLLDVRVPEGAYTEAELRNNVHVTLRYMAAWFGGVGAVAIRDLMEDAATAEISRSQIWQWLHQSVRLEGGATVDAALVRRVIDEEFAAVRGEGILDTALLEDARAILEQTSLGDDFVEFLTLPGYERLVSAGG